MKNFAITFRPQADVPAILSETLGFFESLQAPPEMWARALGNLGWRPYHRYHEDAAGNPGNDPWGYIVAHACPEEGDIWPARAEYGAGWFSTPASGTEINIWVEPDNSVTLTVEFGRDSKFAVTMLLARIAHHDPGAYELLADAAMDLYHQAISRAAMSRASSESRASSDRTRREFRR